MFCRHRLKFGTSGRGPLHGVKHNDCLSFDAASGDFEKSCLA
jgi:hypothetical protein